MVTPLVAKGRVGVVDAALVRWLTRQKAQATHLLVRVTEGVFEPLVPKQHIEAFLADLEPVDQVLGDDTDLSEILHRHHTSPESVRTIRWPDAELLDYSIGRICKRMTLLEEEATTDKLTTLAALQEHYGRTPQHRNQVVGLVSGTFDLIHPGHVFLLQAARRRVDVLVALTMSTAAIQRQEKNRHGDRPIYSESDRSEVLSALRPVDHLVMVDDSDCRSSLQAFCPTYFIKSTGDRSRPVVQAEATLVSSLGGETIYLPDHHPGYSSTTIIRHVRQHEARLCQIERREHNIRS